MLNKKNRLAKTSEIKAVFSKGRAFFNPFFNLKFLSQNSGKHFAVVVSAKIYKSAVKRNRLKRLVREYVKKNLATFKTGSYTIVAKPKVNTITEKEMLSVLKEVCSKIR